MKPRGLVTLLTAALAALALSGCATSQTPVSQYTLPDAPIGEHDIGATAEHQLVIRPIRLASYLDVEGIVLQVDELTVRAARTHQWAEPLGRQLERGLRDRLAARLPDTRVLLDDATRRQDTPVALRIEMTRFQGRHDGQAIAEGRWQLRDASGELLALTPFRLTTTLQADGYPALVKALGANLDRLAEQLAGHIRQLR
ncbi:PqiC family protein [Halomonas halmophila]|uniref:ABC-type transport auxiliary lipoprotein component domain-containing protein n=1 Tax=Halomonas halmophila TaxID=252 RepID=A0A4Y4F4K5_9GAMM|nr:ABC-type transport auxiliary lipoprotein family protein [Halomonas halmophila]GED22764.1 hypothetical protein HHA01_17410 [Halomonas halmophila]